MSKKNRLLSVLACLLLICSACSQADLSHLSATMAAFGGQSVTETPAAQESATADSNSNVTPVPGQAPTAESERSTPTATASASTINVDPNMLTGLTIQFWHPWSGEVGEALRKLVETYNLTNQAGIQVQVQSPGSQENLDAQVAEAVKAGHPPDLVVAPLFQALDWEPALPLVDLAPYVTDPTWGLSPEDRADFYPVFWKAAQSGEKLQGLPALGGGQALIYNQSWAQALGFAQPPVTPEQFKQQACAAATANKQDATKDNDGSGGLILSTDYSQMLGWLAGFGAQVFDPSTKTGSPYHFASQQVQQGFTFLRSLLDQGCAWLPDQPYPETAFAARQGLFAIESIANLPYLERALQHSGSQDRWTVIPFPSSQGKPAMDTYSLDFEIFPSTPERQLAAWLFARWMLSPQNQAALVQATNDLPVRQSALKYLQEYQAANPGWAAAQLLTANAQAEPGARSWNLVRWALSDAATQLFRSYFTIDKVGELTRLLDQTAKDLLNH
jgi:multiple sugar transport system substrate-binding protein